jgi:uncharacterized membrane protein YidH (DUF202 family)
MTDLGGSSARLNSEFVDISPPLTHDPIENTALLPRRPPQPPRLSPLMTRMLGEKRTASFSPPPLSRRAPAPPSTPIGDHGSMVDTPRNSISESSPTLPSGISTPSSRSQSQTRDKISSWTRRIMPTLVLENSGSVARDHLSSERTFLAYVRTSLAIASTGVGERTIVQRYFHSLMNCSNCLTFEALVQLFTISGFSTNQSSVTLTTPRIQIYARPLGAVTVIMGLVVLVIGTSSEPNEA